MWWTEQGLCPQEQGRGQRAIAVCSICSQLLSRQAFHRGPCTYLRQDEPCTWFPLPLLADTGGGTRSLRFNRRSLSWGSPANTGDSSPPPARLQVLVQGAGQAMLSYFSSQDCMAVGSSDHAVETWEQWLIHRQCHNHCSSMPPMKSGTTAPQPPQASLIIYLPMSHLLQVL
jgi:hypothetical protein